MTISAEEAATVLFDDYGLSEGDSNDEGDDIYGYLGEPVLSHADLIPAMSLQAIGSMKRTIGLMKQPNMALCMMNKMKQLTRTRTVPVTIAPEA